MQSLTLDVYSLLQFRKNEYKNIQNVEMVWSDESKCEGRLEGPNPVLRPTVSSNLHIQKNEG